MSSAPELASDLETSGYSLRNENGSFRLWVGENVVLKFTHDGRVRPTSEEFSTAVYPDGIYVSRSLEPHRYRCSHSLFDRIGTNYILKEMDLVFDEPETEDDFDGDMRPPPTGQCPDEIEVGKRIHDAADDLSDREDESSSRYSRAPYDEDQDWCTS